MAEQPVRRITKTFGGRATRRELETAGATLLRVYHRENPDLPNGPIPERPIGKSGKRMAPARVPKDVSSDPEVAAALKVLGMHGSVIPTLVQYKHTPASIADIAHSVRTGLQRDEWEQQFDATNRSARRGIAALPDSRESKARAAAARAAADAMAAEVAAAEEAAREKRNAEAVAKRQRLEERLQTYGNSMIISEQDRDRLIELSRRAINERVAAGNMAQSDGAKMLRSARYFWNDAFQQHVARNPGNNPDLGLRNVVVMREGGHLGRPIGYMTFAPSKTASKTGVGHIVLHLTDGFIEPDYRISGKYGALRVFPETLHQVVNSLRDAAHAAEGVPPDEHGQVSLAPLTAFLTYDPAFHPRAAKPKAEMTRGGELRFVPGKNQLEIYGPVAVPLTGRPPSPSGTVIVNAIPIRPRIQQTSVTPFQATEAVRVANAALQRMQGSMLGGLTVENMPSLRDRMREALEPSSGGKPAPLRTPGTQGKPPGGRRR